MSVKRALVLGAVLSAMMVFVGNVQAETNPFWLVNGSQFTSGLNPSLEAETDVEGSLLTTLGGKEIHLRCPRISFVGAHLVEPTAQFSGKVLYRECKFFSLEGTPLVEKEQKFCEPSAGGVKGSIETNSLTGSIALHEPKVGEKIGVLEVKPSTGTLLVTINLGELCAFGELLKIGNGKSKSGETLSSVLFLEDPGFSVDAVKHLVKELSALTTLYANGGETKATINGSAWAFLAGAHAGLTFSGQPD